MFEGTTDDHLADILYRVLSEIAARKIRANCEPDTAAAPQDDPDNGFTHETRELIAQDPLATFLANLPRGSKITYEAQAEYDDE